MAQAGSKKAAICRSSRDFLFQLVANLRGRLPERTQAAHEEADKYCQAEARRYSRMESPGDISGRSESPGGDLEKAH